MDSRWDQYGKRQNCYPPSVVDSDMFFVPQAKTEDRTATNLRRFTVVEELRRRKASIDQEPFAGLETKKNKKTSELLQSMLPDIKKVVRTVRLDQEKADGSHVYYCLHVFMLSNGTFEGIVRIGNQPDTSVKGYFHRFSIGDASAVETFATSFKHINQVFDGKIKVVSDLSAMNSAVVRAMVNNNNQSSSSGGNSGNAGAGVGSNGASNVATSNSGRSSALGGK